MPRVGILSFSDGRDFVHKDVASFVAEVEARIAVACQASGHDVVRGSEPITSNHVAVYEARRLAAQRPDITIFNYPVWAFPHFSVHAAHATTGPLLLFSNIDPTYPGMVGMLAAAGSLDQMGRRHERLWGDVGDQAVRKRLDVLVRAAHAVRSLEGSTFGRIGGRSMGMYTAVSRTDEWMARFGIDVEEIDQWEIVRRSGLVSPARARAGREWLEKAVAAVHYDGKALTPEILELQVRSYYAMKELIEEWHLDFTGIKSQPELTNHFVTTDIAEAFLNDPYDWDGPKETHVCATEVDMDGALTMQIMKKITGTPVLFADVRHYFPDREIWDLENSGQHATWFAARSEDPAENLSKVHLYPEDFYFPAGGAAVHHLAAPGQMTFARLSRLAGRYRMQMTAGEFESYDDATNEALMRQSTYVWPHAFARFRTPAAAFLSRFGANHIHAVPGDLLAELEAVCRFLDIDLDRLDDEPESPAATQRCPSPSEAEHEIENAPA
jgi:L-fucose isomerase